MKNIRYLFMVIIIVSFLPIIAFADMGEKPSITLKIKNLNTTNYLADIFVYDENNTKYTCDMDYNGEGLSDEQIKQLYDLNYDNWISASTRWSCNLLFSEDAGNANFEHTFSYFGTPDEYKVVIINNDTGEIKISDKIVRTDFSSNVVIDYNNMNIVSSNNNISKTIINSFIVLIVTVVLEVVLAIILKIKNYKVIVLTNIITNLGLQSLLLLFTNNFLLIFIIGEIAVIVIELIIYLLKLKNVTKLKITIYTLLANIITILATFLIK